ncbi:uncharacterized protein LOC120664692 [Panicum virgatum]|uniref:uncharacterized protein LOC120664692 n=1 Tax=Panicum virgatum TaxID=38727 RepID=UPI0019D555D9|nr:uncharacterized protein LOC120664692 [Panicum virgatum]
MEQRPASARVVTIPFADLEDRGKDLNGVIGDGFGRQGLGIVSIADVPGYPELRKRLLRLAPRVANLPEEVKKGLEDPNSRYNFGWSHGKQKFESGKFDSHHTADQTYGQMMIFPSFKQVTFKDDELAYMTGETAEILSRGHLRATPHCVKAPSCEDASLVDRSTFALFVQPNWDEKIKFPSEFPYHQELSIPPNETLAYGEYSERILNKHYEART